jgi:hypothetical protein
VAVARPNPSTPPSVHSVHTTHAPACLVRYHDARRATGYGLLSADYQAHMDAMSFNLRTWVTLTRERRKPKRARPRDDSA